MTAHLDSLPQPWNELRPAEASVAWGSGTWSDPVGLRPVDYKMARNQPFEWFLARGSINDNPKMPKPNALFFITPICLSGLDPY